VRDLLLEVRGLRKSFRGAPALRGIDLELERGSALGLVGRSGSGKSTLARLIARFERPDAGEIRIGGSASYTHADVQLIFQEAAASLNPRFTALEIVCEPLAIERRGSPAGRRESALRWIETVGLPRAAAGKPALAFSGGERQRLAIARALAVEPRLLILDESLSGLDVLLQAQITALLRDLRERLGLTLILVSHDLGLAGRVADRIAVMHEGSLAAPEHAAARELADASRWLSLGSALA
jgi:ABC-type dipeptide/oligopeptide/nickel transport system ATPase subunit